MNILVRILTVFVFICFVVSNLFAQDEIIQQQSTYNKFLSDRGTLIIKDYFEMSPLASSSSKLSVNIIRIVVTQGEKFFLSLSAKGQYSDKTAVIYYEDLLEINKALSSISIRSKIDIKKQLEYREVYFITNDGFIIGYLQQEKEQKFFIDLDDYQSDDTYFFSDVQNLKNTINNSITKINELKK